MKKIALGLVLLSLSLFAQKAILIDVISENIIKVKENGEIKKLHLAGIELFAKANQITREVSLDKKEKLKQNAIFYLKQKLKVGQEFTYSLLYTNTYGVKKVWLDVGELNYKMIRDGYAIVDLKDEYLPSFFQMRMTMAMKYAKDKKLGLWGKDISSMLSLIDKTKHMCGWKNQNQVQQITKLRILQQHQESLPKSVRFNMTKKIAMK